MKNFWPQIIYVFIGFPVALFLLYLVTRIISVAFLHSWWDTKLWYNKKLLDIFKENPPKGQEGKNGN